MPKVCPVCGGSFADTSVFCPADGASLRAESTDGDLIGSVIAERYLVTELLGQGGMGTVYVARHVRLPLQAAIKVLRQEMLQDTSAIARFNREAANASRIEHERVARVFDFGETRDGLVYLAMEYIPGVELKQLIKAGPLPVERTLDIIRQVADGLDAAHKLGIVHRDLKPDNIMVVVDDTGTDRCKILDFGIAKAVGGTDAGTSLTRTGFVVGTPEFMSPEQLLGETIDARSDVYALALVAYNCLTADLPFDSKSPDRGMTARLFSDPRPLREVYAEGVFPEGLQRVFDQALDRDVGARPASAGAFAKQLDAVMQAGGVPTSVVAAADPGGRAPASDATAMIAAPIRTATPAAGGDQARRTSGNSWLRAVAVSLVLLGAVSAWLARRDEGTTPVTTPPTAAAPVMPATPPPSAPKPVAGAVQPAAPRVTAGSAGQVPLPEFPRSDISASAQAARVALDSITRLIDPESPNPVMARDALRGLLTVLPRLGNARDSTWAWIRTAEAHLILQEEAPACTALQAARRIATSPDQSRAITNYVGMLGCTP